MKNVILYLLMLLSFYGYCQKDVTKPIPKHQDTSSHTKKVKKNPTQDSKKKENTDWDTSDTIAIFALLVASGALFLQLRANLREKRREKREVEDLRIRVEEEEKQKKLEAQNRILEIKKASSLIREILNDAKKMLNVNAKQIIVSHIKLDVEILHQIGKKYKENDTYFYIVHHLFIDYFEGLKLFTNKLEYIYDLQKQSIEAKSIYLHINLIFYSISQALYSEFYQNEDETMKDYFGKLAVTFTEEYTEEAIIDIEEKKDILTGLITKYKEDIEGTDKIDILQEVDNLIDENFKNGNMDEETYRKIIETKEKLKKGLGLSS